MQSQLFLVILLLLAAMPTAAESLQSDFAPTSTGMKLAFQSCLWQSPSNSLHYLKSLLGFFQLRWAPAWQCSCCSDTVTMSGLRGSLWWSQGSLYFTKEIMMVLEPNPITAEPEEHHRQPGLKPHSSCSVGPAIPLDVVWFSLSVLWWWRWGLEQQRWTQ